MQTRTTAVFNVLKQQENYLNSVDDAVSSNTTAVGTYKYTKHDTSSIHNLLWQ